MIDFVVKAALAKWKPLEEQISEAQALFEEDEIKAFVAKQIKGKYVDKNELEQQLTTLKNNWHEIREKLKKQIIPYKESRKNLELAGAPVTCEQIGISRERLRETFYKAQTLRNRFTVLDVAVRTGYMDEWIEDLFGESGIL